MAKHISSSEYQYIPIEYVIENARLKEKIRVQKVKIREQFREIMGLKRLRSK